MNVGLPSKRWLWSIVGLAAAIFFLLAWPQGDVAAHANLSRAEPAPNSELPGSPERIVLWFSEGIEPDLADIRVLNARGEGVDNDDVSTQGNPVESVFVSLPTLENGTYTVSWANVSTVDGHRVRGSFLYSVGEPSICLHSRRSPTRKNRICVGSFFWAAFPSPAACCWSSPCGGLRCAE